VRGARSKRLLTTRVFVALKKSLGSIVQAGEKVKEMLAADERG
jgi:hypothetical protein